MRAHLFGFAPGLFLLTLVVAAYGQFLPLYFAGGDTLALIWSSRLESPLDALSLFSEPLLSGTSFPFDTGRFFRPVATLSYGLTYALVGLNPLAFHLTDLALHAGVCVGALMLLRRLGMEAWASAFAIGIFALHPLMVAVVPDIARRHDPLAALLVLTACLSASRALCASQTERRSTGTSPGQSSP